VVIVMGIAMSLREVWNTVHTSFTKTRKYECLKVLHLCA